MPAEPGAGFGMLVRGVIVDDQVHLAPGRGFAVDLVEKADELLMPVAAHALADDLAVEHVERHTCFCGLFPDPITASSRSRSPGPSFLAAARDAHQVSQQGFRWRSPRRSRSGAAREPGRPPDACSADLLVVIASRAGDGNPLALPAGKLSRQLVRFACQPEAVQQFGRAHCDFRLRQAVQPLHRQHHILSRAENSGNRK